MSGTSADGIDAVVAEISRAQNKIRARVVAHVHRPFGEALRRHILHVSVNGTVSEICDLNFVLGHHFAKAALAVIRKAGVRPANITGIGSHGQTVHHLPNAAMPSTLQIGEAAIIAELTGIATVADFRVGDMAAGGQGAPLVPFADWTLFTDPSRPRIVQNIGGIGNLTFLPPGAKLNEVLAFDTGPGNMVIDAVVAKLSQARLSYDRHGGWARRGRVSTRVLKELMRHPFLRRPPPKTTGREEFGERFAARTLALAKKLRLRSEDVVATVTAFTATSIADAYARFVFPKIKTALRPKLQVILGGGGAKNPTVRRMLEQEIGPRLDQESRSVVDLVPTLSASFVAHPPKQTDPRSKTFQILTHEHFGIANAAKEALAFAILAHETLARRPGNVPSTTGARRPVVLGKIVNPRSS